MSNELKISKLQSDALKALAEKHNVNGGKTLDKAELMLFKGDEEYKKLQAEVAKESDDVKALLGFTATQSTTEAAVVTSPDAKKETKKTPLEEVKEAYFKARGYNPETGEKLKDAEGKEVKGATVRDAYKAVEKEFKGKGKEYKAALKEIKKYAKHVDAHKVAENAIKASDSTKSKDVKSDAEQILKNNHGGKMDKWEKHALHNTDRSWLSQGLSWASGRNSYVKDLRKAVAAGNKAAEVAEGTYTQKNFEDAIGKKSPLTMQNRDGKNVLEAAGLIENLGNGEYSVEKLSALVKDAIGADNTLNRLENKEISETYAVKDNLRAAFREAGVEFNEKITDHDIRQLVKFLGYKVERKNYAKTAYDTILGGLLAAGSTAFATSTNPQNVVKAPIDVHQKVEVPIDLGTEELAQQLLDNLKNNPKLQGMEIVTEGENGSITTEVGKVFKIGAEVTILVDQLVTQNRYIEFSKYVLNSSIKAGLVGAGLGLLNGLLDFGPSEQAIFPTIMKCTTYEGMMAVIDGRVKDGKLTQQQAEALKLIAMDAVITETDPETGIERAKTVKNPKTSECEMLWDCCKFFETLREHGGNIILNKVEVAMAEKENPVVLKDPEKAPCEETKKENKTYCPEHKYIPTEDVVTPAPKTEKFEDWGVFASRYDCLKDIIPGKKFKYVYDDKLKKMVPNSYARTMMKLMQAITDNNFDIGRLQKLTDAAQSGNVSVLKAEQGFNYEIYKALRGNTATNTFAMTKQNMPTITTIDGNNVKVDICAPTAPLYNTGRQSGDANARNINIGNASNSRKGDDIYDGTITTSDGQTLKSKSQEEQNGQIAELESKKYTIDPNCKKTE